MTIAIINTDMNIGPFKIPGNGQNMILNNYAERNNIVVEEIIPEPCLGYLFTKRFTKLSESKVTLTHSNLSVFFLGPLKR